MAGWGAGAVRSAGQGAARPYRSPSPIPGTCSSASQPDVVAGCASRAYLVGWGEAVRVTLPADDDGSPLGEKWLRSVFDAAEVDDRVRARGSGPVAFGSFTFDASSDGSVMIVPRTVLGRDGRGRAWLTSVAPRGDDPPGNPPAPGGKPFPPGMEEAPSGTPSPWGNLRWRDGSLPGPRWEQAVAEAVAAIRAGGLRKVVLARDVFATADEPIDARVLLRRLARRYPDCFTFSCDGMIGATPELLVRRAGNQVSALVLGGTLPRGPTRRRTRRWARNCWPRRRTTRSTPTRSTRYARRSGRCARRSTSRRARRC